MGESRVCTGHTTGQEPLSKVAKANPIGLPFSISSPMAWSCCPQHVTSSAVLKSAGKLIERFRRSHCPRRPTATRANRSRQDHFNASGVNNNQGECAYQDYNDCSTRKRCSNGIETNKCARSRCQGHEIALDAREVEGKPYRYDGTAGDK